ncbi:MAG: methyltransferase domain-containing protein [Deltaproteobacteria bacterium]|nr:methyltransferase domain-containing protein [Deltaproteobacteria bacterium]
MLQPYAHSARLAALAAAHGIGAATLGAFRYLAFGSGSGEELLSLASRFPASELVGVDLGEGLDLARRAAKACGLDNVRFVTLEAVDGAFDFVVAHELFARLDAELLALLARRLTPTGVALLGYHTLPGAALSALARRVVMRAVREDMSLAERRSVAQTGLGVVARHVGAHDDALSGLVRSELLDVAARLEEPHVEGVPPIDDALNVAEFVAEARRAGLEFVARGPHG